VFLRAVVRELAADWPLFLIFAAYAVAAATLALILDRPEKIVFLEYFGIWTRAVVTIGLVYIALIEVPASIRASPRHPLDAFVDKLSRVITPRLIAGAVLILALAFLMGCFTSVKNMPVDIAPFRWDLRLAKADAWLHGGRDPWRWLQPALGHRPITRAIQTCMRLGGCSLACLAASHASRRLAPIRLRSSKPTALWIYSERCRRDFMSMARSRHVTGDAARFADQLGYLSFSTGAELSVDLQRDLERSIRPDAWSWAAEFLGVSGLHFNGDAVCASRWSVSRRSAG
jgi:hypothetical protein